jgi:polyphosphate kinase 2 (PPK2 family)
VISKDEQRRRFLQRIDDPDRHSKFSPADVRERTFWDDYQHAFSEMLSHTSTEWAPWYLIPGDHKWFARAAAAAVIASALIELDPRYPVGGEETRREMLELRAALEAESGADGAGRHGR